VNVPLTRPFTGRREQELVAQIIDSGWLTQGPRVTEFEKLVAGFVGARHAVAVANCTTALHLALLLYGIGPGDEVIVPSYTWIATPNVVRMVGATPVFADIEMETFNVSAATISTRITPRTRAMMPVHQFGLACDMDPIRELAEQHNLVVIEDAACALGSGYKGKPVGGLGSMACFSFHPRKLISTGEGGMLVTDDGALAEHARKLLNHGASVSDLHKHRAGTVEALLAETFPELGYNYRMTNLQGALGVAQMERLEGILRLRRQKAVYYFEALESVPAFAAPLVPGFAEPNWQSYAIRVTDACLASRNDVAQRLLDAGIACRPGYMTCHSQPVYEGPDHDLPNTDKAYETVIILPLYPQMEEAEQQYVVDRLMESAAKG
jgi:dTDP-4-amino-4,6-dideoxygalactose transaminase